ncbi:MAG: hypothetical protein GY869_05600, partial [Planctomycetes bacterium]|nr:hypothetical protein [Planctomycetota bacterium]
MSTRSTIQIVIVALCFGLVLGCGQSSTDSQQSPVIYRQSACLENSSTGSQPGNTNQGPYIVESWQEHCLDSLTDVYGDSTSPGGVVRFEVAHDTVRVYHDSAFYNCCDELAYV